MARAALPLLCLAACAGAAAGQTKPLISTDLIYDTYALIYGGYSLAWEKADIDGLLAKIPLDDVKKEVSKQMAQLPPEATQAINEVQTKSVQLKALALEYMDKAYEPANEVAVAAITKLESQVPALKGLIPKTLGNLVLFLCYICFVLYMALKVFFFIFRIALGFFCCFCCCGCCRRGSGKAAAEKNGKTKAASKGKTAASAASAGNSKTAAPKPKAKK